MMKGRAASKAAAGQFSPGELGSQSKERVPRCLLAAAGNPAPSNSSILCTPSCCCSTVQSIAVLPTLPRCLLAAAGNQTLLGVCEHCVCERHRAAFLLLLALLPRSALWAATERAIYLNSDLRQCVAGLGERYLKPDPCNATVRRLQGLQIKCRHSAAQVCSNTT